MIDLSHRYASYHAMQRAIERYHIVPHDAVWRGMLLDITDTVLGLREAAELKRRMPNGREKWLLTIGGTVVPVIYSPATACVVTLLK